MKRGIFCISIDHELLWGRKNIDFTPFIPGVKKERKIIKRLLNLFRRYDIPATWAIVGKLFEKGNFLWHAPDTIIEIKKLKNQEIAYHSYSHSNFTELSEKQAEAELKRISGLSSFVFPGNKIAHLKLLKKFKFKTFRGSDKRSWELLYPGTPPVHQPRMEGGLLNIPGSMYFVSGRGIRKYIPQEVRYFKVRLGIEKAIKERRVFHLWFHPIDFADDSKKLFSDFEEILAYVAQKRKEGKLEVKSMREIAKKFFS